MGARIQLPGSTALVTGAGSGIGRATAIALARSGANVLAVDLDETNAKATAASCEEKGVRASAYQCDVADRPSVLALAEQVTREYGALGVLVNNAGVGMSGRFTDMSLDDWDWIRSINLDGVLNGCHAFVPSMLEAGRGQVVNISSGLGYIPSAMTPAYSTTKAAVLMFTRSVRSDWAQSGVGATAICPGVINTPIISNTRFATPDPDVDRQVAQRGFNHGHKPETVAKAIIAAIERDRAVVPVGFEARVGWALAKVLPQSLMTFAGRPAPDSVRRRLGRR